MSVKNENILNNLSEGTFEKHVLPNICSEKSRKHCQYHDSKLTKIVSNEGHFKFVTLFVSYLDFPQYKTVICHFLS